MRPRNDLSRSFNLSGCNQTYLHHLQTDDVTLAAIRAAERDIREVLSTGLPAQLEKRLLGGELPPKPKFRRQGSGAYGLLNDPLRGSENYAEADADLGVYQPLTALKKTTDSPSFAANHYLDAVQAVLSALAATRGWAIKRKTCCIRIRVRYDAHVDVTCYVVPDDEFRQMAKAFAFSEALNRAGASIDELERDLSWDEIPERPMLATDNGWRRSNAKAIHEVIDNAAKLYGPALKRIIRYVKGARDFNDDPKGPCSIAITLILVNNLGNSPAATRDDLGVLAALGIVADGLMKKLPTPGDDDIDILEGLDYSARLRLAGWLRAAQAQVRAAIFEQTYDQAHDTLRTVFSTRFPTAAEAPAESVTAPVTAAIVSSSPAVSAKRPPGNVRSA